ncbi:hypothetical protein HRbin11_00590 [bacterium HR11]|nr:hypothetical protein HRbin11_00590 [bacterium HR11]
MRWRAGRAPPRKHDVSSIRQMGRSADRQMADRQMGRWAGRPMGRSGDGRRSPAHRPSCRCPPVLVSPVMAVSSLTSLKNRDRRITVFPDGSRISPNRPALLTEPFGSGERRPINFSHRPGSTIFQGYGIRDARCGIPRSLGPRGRLFPSRGPIGRRPTGPSAECLKNRISRRVRKAEFMRIFPIRTVLLMKVFSAEGA